MLAMKIIVMYGVQNKRKARLNTMAKMVYKNRVMGGYKYVSCPKCNYEIEVNHPIELGMPYCSDCDGIVLDATQKYCCWCGEKFERKKVEHDA